MFVRFQLTGSDIAFHGQRNLAVVADEHNLGEVELIEQHAVCPVDVVLACTFQLFIIHGFRQWLTHAGFRQLCKQAHYFLPAGDVLVQVAEIRAQLLEISLVIKLLQLVEYQGAIDNEGQQQGDQPQRQQEKRDLAA